MKIIFFSREYPPDTQWGGEAIACQDMARIFSTLGYDVHVICQSINKYEIKKDNFYVNIHRVGRNSRRYSILARIDYTWYALKELFRIAKPREKCIIHGFYWGSDIFTYSLVKFLRIRNFPMIVHAHGSLRDSIKVARRLHSIKDIIILNILLFMADFTAKKSKNIIAISQAMKDELIIKSHISANKINLLFTPRDTNKYVYTQSNLKDELGVDGNTRIILTVGRLEERKGSKLLCDAISKIKQYYPTAILIFIGNDTPQSPVKGTSYKKYLLSTVAKDNLDSIMFIQDVTNKYLVEAYSIADVIVSASLFEISTSVPIEAMSCGKPVVVTDTGNARLLGIDGYNGIIIPSNDITALENAIIKILGLTTEQRDYISKVNPQIIKERFSYEYWKKELKNLADEWTTW